MEQFIDKRVNPLVFYSRYWIVGIFTVLFAALTVCVFTFGLPIEKLNNAAIVGKEWHERNAERLIDQNFEQVFFDYSDVSFFLGLDDVESTSSQWEGNF